MVASPKWRAQERGCSRRFRALSQDIDSVEDHSTFSIDRAKALEWRVELVYRDLIAKEVAGEFGIRGTGGTTTHR